MSTGNTPSVRAAEAITLLRSDRYSVTSLARATGAHRVTMSKLIRALQAGGHVEPHGSTKSGRGVALLWRWVEQKPLERPLSDGAESTSSTA